MSLMEALKNELEEESERFPSLLFGHLRVLLDDKGIMQYLSESDPLYDALNRAEAQMNLRMMDIKEGKYEPVPT